MKKIYNLYRKFKYPVELFLLVLFVADIALATVSNNTHTILLLKSALSILLLLTIYMQARLEKVDLKLLAGNKNFKKNFFTFLLFTGYLAVTILYSQNKTYGLNKILVFIVSIIPLIIAAYYLVITNNKKREQLFLFIISAFIIFTVIYIIVDYPFEQGTVYNFRPGRWSHVIYGRMAASASLITLFYIYMTNEKKRVVFYSIIAATGIYGTYLSALRSASLGLLFAGFILLVFALFEGRSKNSLLIKSLTQVSKVSLPFFLAAFFTLVIPHKEIVNLRYENLVQIENLDFKGDGAIHSRLSSYELSWKMFLNKPVTGYGFGSFKGYSGLEWTKAIKYPHNLILEIAAECGIIGLLVLFYVLFILFKNSISYSPFALIFILFALFLSMFAKDVSAQPLLWIGFGFVRK